MGTEIDYGAVLADLEAKRVAIDAAIAGVRQVMNLGVEQAVAPAMGVERREQPTSLRFDSFFRMPMPSAIVKFLEMSKTPQSVSDITKALLDGGFKTTSKNLMPTVGSNLSRMKSAGELVNVEGKWGLASWYPAARKAEATAPLRNGRKRGRPKGSKTINPEAATTKPDTPKAQSSKLTAEQVGQMKALHAAGKSVGEIAKALGIHHLTVWRTVKPKEEKAAA